MAAQPFFVQPPFDNRLTNSMAFPLTGGPNGPSTLQLGYMIWDKPLPGYSQRAVISYLYNPSTVSSDYAMSNASAQAALNYPNPGDTAMLAIPISQTAQWSLMFDRTFEVQGVYQDNGLPTGNNNSLGAGTLGVQADVMAFMQFTGMFYQGGNLPSTVQAQNTNLATNSGIMMQWPSWALFGNSAVSNGLMYYGYINEWSVQYTHWTQQNVPMRCVISVNWTMLSMPNTLPPSNPANLLPTPTGSANSSSAGFLTGQAAPGIGSAGIGGT